MALRVARRGRLGGQIVLGWGIRNMVKLRLDDTQPGICRIYVMRAAK